MTAIWMLLLMSCGGDGEAPGPDPSPPAQAPAPAAVPTAPAAPAPDDDAEADDDGAPQAAQGPHTMAARHILIQYAGAPTSQATRTRAEALALAEQTVAELKAGADFGALAAERSGDASNAQVGGFLGAFSSGTMVPEFERALLALSPGELSKPVETPYGFHIIQRVAVLERHFATIYVAILPDGSYAQPRTPAEAHARAELALARVEAGEPFGAVARHWSDGRGAKWGGDMGLVQQGTYPPALDGPLFALEPGEHTAVLDSKLGSHIFVRLE